MCTVSMVGDFYADKWKWVPAQPIYPVPSTVVLPSPITREEFDLLRREVADMKELLRRAKAYDEANGDPDCELDEKLAVLRRVAELVGIDLGDVLAKAGD